MELILLYRKGLPFVGGAMGESTILKVTVNQEEVIFLETTMTLEKKAGEHTAMSLR